MISITLDATSRCRVEFEPEEVVDFEKVLGIDSSRVNDFARRSSSD